MEQVRGIYGIIIHPRQTLLALPSHRLYVLAVVAPFYFGIGRTFRFVNNQTLFTWLGSGLMKLIFAAIITAIVILVGTWIMQQILVLFRKRISIIKLLNIYGYSLVPRLIVAGIAYVVMLSNPSMFSEVGNAGSLAMLILGGGATIYTLILYFYGIGVCPSET
jgi:hypothetical protein